MAFNNKRFDRPRSGSRDRASVEMHKAICDNCKKECEVPFRPTSGKPLFCRDCFKREDNGGSSRSFEQRGPERSGDRQMFDSVCSDCGDACKVPFQPSGDKPVFCSNCFGDKKNAVTTRDNNGDQKSNFALKDKMEDMNAKLDIILSLLTPPQEVEPAKKAKRNLQPKSLAS